MANRIRALHLHDRLDDPAEAEVWVSLVPESISPTTEVRGRLMGPQCHYASTVEVAYPLRPFARPSHPSLSPGGSGEPDSPSSPRGGEGGGEGLAWLPMRVIIPEASLWDPESPFLYHGPVELWEDGRRCDQWDVRHGLRRFSLGPRGLRCNGRAMQLHGVVRDSLTEAEALELRARGCNLIVAPVREAVPGLWEAADRLGFLVIGRIDDVGAWRLAGEQSGHCSCLGWLLARHTRAEGIDRAMAEWREQGAGGWLGVELAPGTAGTLPEGVGFVLCAEASLPELTDVSLPKIVRMEHGVNGQARAPAPGVVGWVEDGLP